MPLSEKARTRLLGVLFAGPLLLLLGGELWHWPGDVIIACGTLTACAYVIGHLKGASDERRQWECRVSLDEKYRAFPDRYGEFDPEGAVDPEVMDYWRRQSDRR